MKNICYLLVVSLFALTAFAMDPDQVIVDRAKESLSQFDLGKHDLEITSRFGRVVVTGTLPTARDGVIVQKAIENIEGVKAVVLKVTATGMVGSNAACPNLSFPELTYKGTIAAACSGGVLLLEGEVASEMERMKIEDSVRAQAPTFNVVNRLSVLPEPDDYTIRTKVREALLSGGYGNEQVTFDVNDGVVTYRGEVDGHRAIDAILATTLMIPGVKDARSEVMIR